MIRTIIVDDELLAGVGIQSLIDGQEDIRVTGVFSVPEEAIAFLRENVVDVVITDIEMADMSGLELIQIVRSENLANGIIILSCHDDFSYAQDAISKGTDSYLLKHNISREGLVSEVKKVYRKTYGFGIHMEKQSGERKQEKLLTGDGTVYVVCVPGFDEPEYASADSGQAVDRMMLMHLLEKIVARYDMGTLFAPYDREMFIIFQFAKKEGERKRQEMLYEDLSVIHKNIQQYINGCMYYGISTEFDDLKKMREKYEEAASALEMHFYEPSRESFVYRMPSEFAGKDFSRADFLGEAGAEAFEREVRDYVRAAQRSRLAVWNLKGQIVQAFGRLAYMVVREYGLSDVLRQRWTADHFLMSSVSRAKDAEGLILQMREAAERFREECLSELNENELAGVLAYIDGNLSDKLSLKELSEMSCMSIPSFSRKFKEYTGKTLVQYLNERRIEQAKILLKNKNASLEKIAEEVGFSNANYLIRVFKKVTGQTISEYRK